MGGIVSKARMIADRARLERMLRECEGRPPEHLTESEWLELVESIAVRIVRLDAQISESEPAVE